MYRISSIIISTVFVISFMGCDYPHGHKDVDMGIYAVVISSVSSDRPAEMVIGAYGAHSNTCVSSGAKVYANRDGNKIYLTAKKEISLGPGDCGDAVTEVYGEVTVKNLEVGEYIIMGDGPFEYYEDYELGRLRVESDVAYMQVNTKMYADMYGKTYPSYTDKLDVILSPIVPSNGKFEDTVYHVKIMVDIVEFYIDMTTLFDEYKVPGCEAIYKADIERTENVINLDIWRLVRPADSGCLIDRGIGVPTLRLNATKAEIDIGTLSTGSYTVFIESVEFYFDVSHTTY